MKILCMVILWWINMDKLLYTFVQTHRRQTPRADCKVNYKLWITVMGQCRFIIGNKCPLWGILVLGLLCSLGAGGTRETSCLPLKFTVNLKLLCGNSLTVQWLGLHAYTAEGLGSIAAQGTRIPQGSRQSRKSINECCHC